MLFTSHLYIFLFLPLTVAGFFLLARVGGEIAAICWLILLSLVFYGWWSPVHVPLLLASVVFNYLCGSYLQAAVHRNLTGYILALGVVANLLFLGHFKYAIFFADVAATVTGAEFNVQKIILPLGISFFTFQQIAYLVDSYRQDAVSGGFLRYCLFVTFFPKLITGPIVRHRELMPQLFDQRIFQFAPTNLALGFGIFTIGLCKKVVIADPLSTVVAPAFGLATAGQDPGFYAAWLAAFAYALQVYFDFSGYTDMAIGAALMLGIQLPVNFYSPYKASSIAELWRRWHMTLTHLITEFVFTPISHRLARLALGLHSSRWLFVTLASVLPLVILFVVVGVWHGAGWTFIVFGLFHGTLMGLHALWQEVRRAVGIKAQIPKALGVAMTLLAWVWGVVLFRAPDMATASTMYKAMLNFSAMSGDINVPMQWAAGVILIYALVLVLPNTEQLFHKYRPRLADKNLELSRTSLSRLAWRENSGWAVFLGVLFFLGVVLMGSEVEFIYFQF